jgi:hypothetical protein
MTDIKDSIINISLLVFRLFRGTFDRDGNGSGKVLISWSPSINSMNDHTGTPQKMYFFNKNGFWGYDRSYEAGMNFGAGYAVLPNFIIWKFGTSAFILFSLSVYVALFVILAATTSPWMLLVGFGAVYSPFFKNSVFVTGRLCCPGWALLVMGILLLQYGLFVPATVALSLAFMSHPALPIVGSVYVLGFALFFQNPLASLLSFLVAHLINLFWYIPYLNVQYDVASKHTWVAPLSDPTRVGSVYYKKGAAKLIFILVVFISAPSINAVLFSMIPFMLFVFISVRERIINRFSMELLWLCSAGVACAEIHSLSAYLAYLFSLYFYSSPAPRFLFPFRPLVIDEKDVLSEFKVLEEKLPNSVRLGYVNLPDNAPKWRIDAKHKVFFSHWISRKGNDREFIDLNPILYSDKTFMAQTDPQAIADAINEMGERYSISHFVVLNPYRDGFDNSEKYELVAESPLPKIGDVPEVTYLIYRRLHFSPQVHADKRVVGENGIRCSKNAGWQEIRYRWFPGLTVTQNQKPLHLRPGDDINMYVKTESDSNLFLAYRPSRLWRWPFRYKKKSPNGDPSEPC